MIDLAREKKVFLMEALWTKFMPHYQMVMQLIKEDKLGAVQNVLINFGFAPLHPFQSVSSIHRLEAAACWILDLQFIHCALVLGKPDAIEASITAAPTGVDEQCSILLKYDNGRWHNYFHLSPLTSPLRLIYREEKEGSD
jgi:predicted dehydrogenase